MKKVSEIILPDDLLYTREHLWLKPENSTLRVGISDYAQDQLGELVYADLPEKEKKFNQNEEFATLESVKTVSSLSMPVSGMIREINPILEDNPAEINSQCYDNGWIAVIAADSEPDMKQFLNASEYRDFLENIARDSREKE